MTGAILVAKVQRDRMMDRYHRRFPEYGFRSNKGYGTRHHWETLDRLGPTEIHRMSFKGVGRTWESVEEAMAAEQEQEQEQDQEQEQGQQQEEVRIQEFQGWNRCVQTWGTFGWQGGFRALNAG